MTLEQIREWVACCGHLRFHRPVAIEIIDTLLERITELERQLSRYQGGVEVGGGSNTNAHKSVHLHAC